MKHLLLLALQVASVALANGQQSLDARCDTPHIGVLRQSAREAFDKHQYEVAARHFSEVLHECPAQREILIELSQAQAHLRQFDLAIRSLQQFFEQQPASISGRLALANVYLMAQRLLDAKREAQAILNKQPDNPAAMKIEANAEYLLGDVAAAESRLIELLDRHVDDEEAAYMLGRMYYKEGRIDHAIGQFERVLKRNSQSYKAYDNLGLCYEALGENEKAVRHFLASIKLVENDHSDYEWPFANLAEFFLKEGDAEKAFGLASKAADRNPYSARNFYLGGKALCQLEKTDLCVNWLQRSSALDPSYPEPLYLLSRVYRKLGQDGKAKEAETKFLELKEKQPDRPR